MCPDHQRGLRVARREGSPLAGRDPEGQDPQAGPFDKPRTTEFSSPQMAKPLVIVESPAKARTISGFLGDDWTVLASYGHIRDLPTKGLNVDTENHFKVEYEITADASRLRELKA